MHISDLWTFDVELEVLAKKSDHFLIWNVIENCEWFGGARSGGVTVIGDSLSPGNIFDTGPFDIG